MHRERFSSRAAIFVYLGSSNAIYLIGSMYYISYIVYTINCISLIRISADILFVKLEYSICLTILCCSADYKLLTLVQLFLEFENIQRTFFRKPPIR